MKKAKFEAKCQELITYEDEKLKEVQEFIKPMKEPLEKLGAEIIVRRFWYYLTNNGVEQFSDQRKQIVLKKGYSCSLTVQFQMLGADPDAEDGIGFQVMESVTTFGASFFTRHAFKKYKLKYLYSNVNKCFNEVMENGLERTSKKYNN